ncbi:hypothetical protein D3C75_1087140 [compost metagenome]
MGTLGCCQSGSKATREPSASSSWHNMAGREASPSPAFAASLAQVMLLTWKRDGGSTSTSRPSSSKHQWEARKPLLTATLSWRTRSSGRVIAGLRAR